MPALQRVLIVHNRYSSEVPSGENLVVEEQATTLGQLGLDIEVFAADNDAVKQASLGQRVRALPRGTWSLSAARDLERRVRAFRPDIVHVHNVFPLLSPSVMRVLARLGLPTAWTVHNYRIGCIASSYWRGDGACRACTRTAHLAGVVYGCYAGSRGASAAVTLGAVALRPFARRVTAIAISAHMRAWLVDRQRFDPDAVVVVPNGVPAPAAVGPPPSAGDAVVFAARLAPEKGVDLVLDAWRRHRAPGGRLLVAGSGPEEAKVAAAAAADPSIEA
ncbi:MAG: glycosyltransferase, partial [Acidimicrobiales bacterium]